MGRKLRSIAAVLSAVITVFCATTATTEVMVASEPHASLTLGIDLARGVIRLAGLLAETESGPRYGDPNRQVSLSFGLGPAGSNEPGRGPVRVRLLIGRECSASICVGFQTLDHRRTEYQTGSRHIGRRRRPGSSPSYSIFVGCSEH
jgi:hypothetical protein